MYIFITNAIKASSRLRTDAKNNEQFNADLDRFIAAAKQLRKYF